MHRRLIGTASLLSALVLLSCDRATHPSSVVTAHFLNGATPIGSGPGPALAAGRATAATIPVNGRWMLSADRVTMHLTHIQLGGGASGTDGGAAADVDCTVTYDRAKPALSQLSTCNFSVPTGTYNTLNLTFDTTFSVVVNDAVNGFYSTATGIFTTAPAGGAQTMSVTAPGTGLSPVKLPASLVIADAGAASTASIVVNGLQFLRVDVFGGIVSLGWSGTGTPTPTQPDLIGTVGSPAAAEYYVAQSVGTAGGYCAGGSCPSPPTGITAVGVYYTGPTTPAIMGMSLNDTPQTCRPIGESYVTDPRGYQGLDASGNLGWAISTDATWATYSGELRMARVSTLGGTTTLYCKTRSTDPAPAGGSYASGAPNIAVQANSLGTYILVAK